MKTNNNIMLSIIIPVYNSFIYIERCLNSLATQLTENCEVIIVDDGSKDNSRIIYNKYSKKFKQITTFYKINGGVSSARNFGLTKAKGKYITFVDSDDYVSNNFIEKIFEEIKSDSDLIFFQYNSDDVNTILNNNNNNNSILPEISISQIIKSVFTAKEPIKNFKYNFRAVWSKVIKREIIYSNNITFPENISYGEDMIFMLKVYSNVKSKKINANILYHNFFLHEMSATNKYKPDMIITLKNQEESLLEWIKNYKYSEYESYHALYRLNDIILIIKYDFFHKNNTEKDYEKKVRFKNFINSSNYKNYYQIAKNSHLLQYYKKNKLLFIFMAINNYYFLIKVLSKIRY